MYRWTLLLFLPLFVWGEAHIFVYHRFGDEKHASTNTSIEVLRSEFEYLKQNGYEVISLRTLNDAIKNAKPVKENWVVLTIDDSYKSFYQNGLPLFKEYGYPFTLFVYVEATERRYGDFMSWEQLLEAQKYGEIGLHSYGHHHMVSLTKEAIIQDTKKAYDAFARHLGGSPKYFAYPYGEYDPKVRDAVETFDFNLILNQNSGAIDGDSDPYDLDRTALTGEDLIRQKLRIKTLPTIWLSPKAWPKDGKIKKIHATIPTDITDLEYYLSGYGWQPIKAMNGVVDESVDLPIKLKRSRLFLRQKERQSSIILVKE